MTVCANWQHGGAGGAALVKYLEQKQEVKAWLAMFNMVGASLSKR